MGVRVKHDIKEGLQRLRGLTEADPLGDFLSGRKPRRKPEPQILTKDDMTLVDQGTEETVFRCDKCGEELWYRDVERDEHGDVADIEFENAASDHEEDCGNLYGEEDDEDDDEEFLRGRSIHRPDPGESDPRY